MSGNGSNSLRFLFMAIAELNKLVRDGALLEGGELCSSRLADAASHLAASHLGVPHGRWIA
jgi:hypothetical protein